jgi:Cu/Ag efflux pump CusA
MQNPGPDPAALGCTIISLRLALEETLKALAEKNGNQPGTWLDELQELALLRANAHLTDMKERNAAAVAISVVEAMFERMRSGLSGAP